MTDIYVHILSEAANRGVLCKKVLLEILQNSQENTCASLFFQACNFIKKETLAQVFSCEFCEISNTYSYRRPLVAAFVLPAKKIKKKSQAGIPELVKAIGNVQLLMHQL